MSRHSKRNTASSFFTAFERSLLKSDYGTLKGKLAASSFRPFDACKLCLARSRSPVVCPSNGDLFCRECIMENLLSQRQQIKQFEREMEKRKREEEGAEVAEEEQVRQRAIADFEAVQSGARSGGGGRVVDRVDGKVGGEEERRGEKRKFELDEDELMRIARQDRETAKKAMTEEKAAASKKGSSNFWVPSLIPTAGQSESTDRERKLSPVCPASDPEHPHHLSLKTLVAVNFSEDPQDKAQDGQSLRICPSCKKALSNNMKSYLAPVCGHVTCNTCTALLRESGVCFVCDTPFRKAKKDKDGKVSKKEKIGDADGLIELQVEGSGYAAGLKGPTVELKRQTFG